MHMVLGGRNEVLNPGQESIALPYVGPSQWRGLDPPTQSHIKNSLLRQYALFCRYSTFFSPVRITSQG